MKIIVVVVLPVTTVNINVNMHAMLPAICAQYARVEACVVSNQDANAVENGTAVSTAQCAQLRVVKSKM
jgi:hypothetical protein